MAKSRIGELLFDARAIAERVRELGAEISRDYRGKIPVLIGVLSSAAPFLADLTRAISIPCEFDVIAVTKFTASEGIIFQKDTTASIEGRHVILVADTIDTGSTMRYLAKALASRAPASFSVCTLLDRPKKRNADMSIKYKAFEISNVYVVGYGLDCGGRYRELDSLYARGAQL
ncbi:MAG: hypoxanthine phosphoribosyltransferase [Candidatus Eremiobacteraeota bacterium]|nr:hypoxanthine phosphoribosyltransferase [Candidatus Eremiobacteraeota bacterium]